MPRSTTPTPTGRYLKCQQDTIVTHLKETLEKWLDDLRQSLLEESIPRPDRVKVWEAWFELNALTGKKFAKILQEKGALTFSDYPGKDDYYQKVNDTYDSVNAYIGSLRDLGEEFIQKTELAIRFTTDNRTDIFPWHLITELISLLAKAHYDRRETSDN